MSKHINKVIAYGLLRGDGFGGKDKPTPLATPKPVSPVNEQRLAPYNGKLTMT